MKRFDLGRSYEFQVKWRWSSKRINHIDRLLTFNLARDSHYNILYVHDDLENPNIHTP